MRPPIPAPQPFASVTGDPPFTQKPHSQMRRVIARRLTESKQNVPHFYETIDCEIDELLRIRKVLNDGDPNLNVSVNDFVIRAAGLALRNEVQQEVLTLAARHGVRVHQDKLRIEDPVDVSRL